MYSLMIVVQSSSGHVTSTFVSLKSPQKAFSWLLLFIKFLDPWHYKQCRVCIYRQGIHSITYYLIRVWHILRFCYTYTTSEGSIKLNAFVFFFCKITVENILCCNYFMQFYFIFFPFFYFSCFVDSAVVR